MKQLIVVLSILLMSGLVACGKEAPKTKAPAPQSPQPSAEAGGVLNTMNGFARSTQAYTISALGSYSECGRCRAVSFSAVGGEEKLEIEVYNTPAETQKGTDYYKAQGKTPLKVAKYSVLISTAATTPSAATLKTLSDLMDNGDAAAEKMTPVAPAATPKTPAEVKTPVTKS